MAGDDIVGSPVAALRSQNGLKSPRVKANLSLLMQNNPNDKWSKNVLPSVILWYGNQGNV